MVKEFGEAKGVFGFMVTSARYGRCITIAT